MRSNQTSTAVFRPFLIAGLPIVVTMPMLPNSCLYGVTYRTPEGQHKTYLEFSKQPRQIPSLLAILQIRYQCRDCIETFGRFQDSLQASMYKESVSELLSHRQERKFNGIAAAISFVVRLIIAVWPFLVILGADRVLRQKHVLAEVAYALGVHDKDTAIVVLRQLFSVNFAFAKAFWGLLAATGLILDAYFESRRLKQKREWPSNQSFFNWWRWVISEPLSIYMASLFLPIVFAILSSNTYWSFIANSIIPVIVLMVVQKFADNLWLKI